MNTKEENNKIYNAKVIHEDREKAIKTKKLKYKLIIGWAISTFVITYSVYLLISKYQIVKN